MMKQKTIEKRTKEFTKKLNKKIDKQMKKKYGDVYQTQGEKNKKAREAKKRYEIMQLIFLIQRLERAGLLNEEIRKLSNHLPSQFDKFL